MKELFERHFYLLWLILYFIYMVNLSGCTSTKGINQNTSFDWKQSTYIDSIVIRMPKVEIIEAGLKIMLDTLIRESSMYAPMREFPKYPKKISISTNKKPQMLISLSIGKNYIMSYHFPGAEENNPFYPQVYPLSPTILGMSTYKGYPIDYHWMMKNFISDNSFGNLEILQVKQDSIELTAYATRMNDTNEWVYALMPSVTLYCEVVGDVLIFKRFEYDDGGIKYVK